MGTLPRTGRFEVVTEADPAAVWAVVSDPTRIGEWSHECGGAEWIGDVASARPGARFRGKNRIGRTAWSRVNEVLTADAPTSFSWRTVPSTIYRDSTVWSISLEPVAGGTRIVQTFQVVKLNPVLDRLMFVLVSQHRDRSAALTGDLQRLGDVARAG